MRPPGHRSSGKGVIDQARAYWERIAAGRAMPRREDLDPADIPKLLPFVMLVDVLAEPLDFRFRLIGTAVQAIIARNSLRRCFSELPHMSRGNAVWGAYETVVAERQPVSGRVGYVGADRDVRSVRHCLMPLSRDGQTVNMVFVAVEIDRR